jgi:hypothetical protein
MERIKLIGFSQKDFLDQCILNVGAVSLRGLLDFGFNVSYSSLKNYYTGRRFFPRDFFENLCVICNFNKDDVSFEVLKSNWGQIKGGRVRFKN